MRGGLRPRFRAGPADRMAAQGHHPLPHTSGLIHVRAALRGDIGGAFGARGVMIRNHTTSPGRPVREYSQPLGWVHHWPAWLAGGMTVLVPPLIAVVYP